MKEQAKYTTLTNNLTYHFKGSNTGPIFFIEFRDLF